MIKKGLNWLDKNLLAVLAGFLLVFIPLYPKWPLFDILYGYNVRVRAEDFVVLFSCVVFFIQLVRKKIPLTVNPVTTVFGIYLVTGLLSVLTSIFVIKTVPLAYLHAGKTFLHWLRRLEYFSLFLIIFAGVKSLRSVKVYTVLFFITLLLVTLYGYGQKYLYFPAFSTMNREYSKGIWLYLTEHARVLSTFGGHYDLAGYLVIALTLCWSFLFGLKNRLAKIAVAILLSGGFWLLILTASRASFIAYLLGLTVVVVLWTMRRGIGWGISRYLMAAFLSIFLMLSFGDLSDRFLHLFRWADRFSNLRQIALIPLGPPPKSGIFLENNLAAVTSKSDQPPLPADVTGKELPLLLPTLTASGASVLTPGTRTYSPNAMMFDLSTGIRLDATWPMAIAGFKRDPLLGSGYATLSKTYVNDITEGESTDNDYLRALGETGLLGFLAFFGTIVIATTIAFRSLWGIKDSFTFSLVAGFVGLVVGLLANAVLIDIFEASKVAYVFWGMTGLTLGAIYLLREKIKADYVRPDIGRLTKEYLQSVKKFFLSDVPWVLLVIVLAFVLRLYKIDSPIADWHSWRQADTSAVTRNYIRVKKIDLLAPTYDDLSSAQSGKPNPLGYRFVEFPIYNAVSALTYQILPELSIESAGRVVTNVVSTLSVLLIFLISRQLLSRRVAYFSALAFALLPYSIYYGRVVLPDPSMVTASLAAAWFTIKYLFTEKKRSLLLGILFGAIALLLKPFAIFLLLPIGYLWLKRFGFDKQKLMILGIASAAMALPLGLWRYFISAYPEGIPANGWLLNGDGIRFKGAFWFWLFGDRIGRLILGYWGPVLLGFGLMRRVAGKYHLFPIFYLLSTICYLLVFATGNVRHDYYQILIIPALAIFVGLGVDHLVALGWRGKILAAVASAFMLGFGWYFVRDLYNINHPEIIEAGNKIRELSDWRSKVVAPYDGDTAFLYQTDRQGWPLVERSIDYLISQGAQYYVSVRFDDLTKQLIAKSQTNKQRAANPKLPRQPYTLLVLTDKYVILQLVPDEQLPVLPPPLR